MKLTKIILAAALLCGISIGAQAGGNDNNCEKKGNSYVCSPPGTQTYTFNTATSEADASAKLDAYLANINHNSNNNSATGGAGGAGGQGGEGGAGGNGTGVAVAGASASNGNQTLTVNNPKQTRLRAEISVNADIAEIMKAKNSNLIGLALAVDEVGNNCTALAILNRSPALFSWMDGSRLTIKCAD